MRKRLLASIFLWNCHGEDQELRRVLKSISGTSLSDRYSVAQRQQIFAGKPKSLFEVS
jgi:hypothetical protein